jgi:hypothetical protein
MKQLDRLLFEQGHDCFFCGKPLAKADASIEHLHAVANGGTNAEENVVACCKAINALLSNKPLKQKFAIILRQKDGFRCPAAKVTREESPAVEVPSQHDSAAEFKPIKLATVNTPSAPTRSTPSAVQATRASAAELPSARLLQSSLVTCPTCKSSVTSAVGQLDYVCPRCRGAFRY